MAAVTREMFNAKLVRLLDLIDGESLDFDDFDRILGVAGTERISNDLLRVNAHLDEQIAPIYDTIPRSEAVMATFMYGVMIGQKLVRFGITGVTAQ